MLGRLHCSLSMWSVLKGEELTVLVHFPPSPPHTPLLAWLDFPHKTQERPQKGLLRAGGQAGALQDGWVDRKRSWAAGEVRA